MTLLQAWLIVGVPGLIVTAGLFVGRSRTRAMLGYAVLLLLVSLFIILPGGGYSAVLVGLIGVVFVATGRGTNLDERYSEHHEQRGEYTHVAEDA